MKQGEIIEPVGTAAHFPEDMMYMPSGFEVDRLTAYRTPAGLPPP
jgi:hypothetical protein